VTEKRESSLFVFGCYHKLQRFGAAFLDLAEQNRHEDQQKLFGRTLAEIFLKEQITFLAEEIGYAQPSLARCLAHVFMRPYLVIEMPLAERVRVGCRPDYETLLRINGPNEDAVLRCHEVREQYMAHRIMELAGEKDRGLILCGVTHANRLKQRLQETFTEVKLITLLDYDWFDRNLYG